MRRPMQELKRHQSTNNGAGDLHFLSAAGGAPCLMKIADLSMAASRHRGQWMQRAIAGHIGKRSGNVRYATSGESMICSAFA